jgi:ketosteroid isomerase-like protein
MVVLPVGIGLLTVLIMSGASTPAIDAFWRSAERTVATGDFAAYAALYHPDAVVVDVGRTRLVREALAEWKAGFEATAKGLQSVRLDFRFSQRIDDAESAHETGIFRYEQSVANNNDDEAPPTTTIRFVNFEALMIKKDGRWMWLMEYQKGNASQADWDALAPAMAADERR